MGKLQGLTEALTNARTGLAEELKRHEQEVRRIRGDIATLESGITMEAGGLNLARVSRGSAIVYVEGTITDARLPLLREAMAEVAKPNCGELQHQYIGLKNYDRFVGQREDHRYGMAPRHGSTVFCIGLKRAARERDLTEQEVEDALYWLANAQKIKAAECSGRESASIPAMKA